MFTNKMVVWLFLLTSTQPVFSMSQGDYSQDLIEKQYILKKIESQLPVIRPLTKEKINVGRRYGDQFWKDIYKLCPSQFVKVKEVLSSMPAIDYTNQLTAAVMEEYAEKLGEFISEDAREQVWDVYFNNDIRRRLHGISLSHHDEYQKLLVQDTWFADFINQHPLLNIDETILTESDQKIYAEQLQQ